MENKQVDMFGGIGQCFEASPTFHEEIKGHNFKCRLFNKKLSIVATVETEGEPPESVEHKGIYYSLRDVYPRTMDAVYRQV